MSTLLTIGFFDGVHRGHAALLRYADARAAERGLSPAVLAFDGLRAVKEAGELNLPEDRDLLIRRVSPDAGVYSLRLDDGLCALSAERFFREYLLARFDARHFVVGENFTFGADRRGAEYLSSLAAKEGLSADVLPLSGDKDGVFSSSRIRSLLLEGRIPEANALLGHAHMIRGTVEGGRQIGRTLGFPTVNLPYPARLVAMPLGVYAAYVTLPDGRRFRAVLNLGRRPTFGPGGVVLEAHLLGFEGDLYGRTVEIGFEKLLRRERRFSSPEELREAVEHDKATAEISLSKQDEERMNRRDL